MRKSCQLVCANLWYHNNSSNLLYKRIISWTHSIHVTCYLNSQITNADESFEYIFWKYICIPCLFEIFGVYINVVSPEIEACCRYCSHTPISFRHEFFSFITRENLNDYLLAMNSRAFNGFCLQLSCLFVLLFYPFNLLFLNIDWCNLHSENDVFDFTLSQTGNVNIIFLGVICKDKILQFDLNFHPLLISEVWPYVVRKCYCSLVGFENDLCSFSIQMKCSQNQDQTTECCE